MTPTDAFDAADVPALRRDLLDWLRDGRGLNFHTTMSHQAGTMLGKPHLDGDPTTMRAYAEMVVAQETRTLRDAELYYVTPEMTAIVRDAAADMPAFPPDAADFPTPAGLIVYGAPLVTFDRPGVALPLLAVHGRDVVDRSRDKVSITACTWGPYNAAGGWKRGGVWMSFYRNRAEWTAAVIDDHLMKHVLTDTTRLIPDNEYGIKFEDDPAGRARLEADLAAKDNVAYTSYWAKHLLATLLLMRQPLVYQRAEPVRRGLRRQLERSGYGSRDIRILDARPRRYVGDPEPAEPVADDDQPGEDARRKLGVRFPVRGFWRNQWYPSRGVHRPKWVPPHWRGPDDAPIVHAERVRVLRDHAQPEPDA
jgi:hypothetical protein